MFGPTFRANVYGQGPTLVLISANKGKIFGGYSPISWTDGEEDNWKEDTRAFLFSLTDNKGRAPVRLDLVPDRKETSLFHSRIGFGWGSGHDLSINLVDLSRSESTIFTYTPFSQSQPPGLNPTQIDSSSFLAGQRDNWEFSEIEIYKVLGPIEESRYGVNTKSLHTIALSMMEESKMEASLDLEDYVEQMIDEELSPDKESFFPENTTLRAQT